MSSGTSWWYLLSVSCASSVTSAQALGSLATPTTKRISGTEELWGFLAVGLKSERTWLVNK